MKDDSRYIDQFFIKHYIKTKRELLAMYNRFMILGWVIDSRKKSYIKRYNSYDWIDPDYPYLDKSNHGNSCNGIEWLDDVFYDIETELYRLREECWILLSYI